jgi:hypothetical protein
LLALRPLIDPETVAEIATLPAQTGPEAFAGDVWLTCAHWVSGLVEASNRRVADGDGDVLILGSRQSPFSGGPSIELGEASHIAEAVRLSTLSRIEEARLVTVRPAAAHLDAP